MVNRFEEETEIQNRLKWELVKKSDTAAPQIVILALALSWYQFNIKNNSGVLSALMVASALNALIRLYIGKLGLNGKIQRARTIQLIIYSVILNTVLWSLSMWLVLPHPQISSIDFMAAFMIVTSLSLTSVLSLAYMPAIAFSFQMGLLSSLLYALVNQYAFTTEPEYLYMALATGFLILFCFRMTQSFYREMHVKYQYEVELENSLTQLKISNQKVIEETARSQNASRLAALGEMSGGVAHEINNPLAIINGLVEQTMGLIEKGPEHKNIALEKLNRTLKSVARISRIVKSLRDISRDSDDSEDFVNMSVSELLEDVLNISREKFTNAGIEFQVNGLPNLTVKAKPVLVSQVLINLLNNAFDEVSHQTYKDKYIKILFRTDNSKNKLILSIENSGEKIPAEIQDRIFQPFFTTKEIGKGTGLGLSICKGITESMGEQIWLENNLPNTTFSFTLPLAEKM